jgi:hypothetical protein
MKAIQLLVIGALAASLAACSPQMEAGNSSSGNGTFETPNPTNPPQPGWEKVEFNGVANGGTNRGSLVIYIDRANQALILVTPIPVLMPILAPIEFPDMPGAKIFSFTNPDGSQSLAASIPLEYVVRGGRFGAGQRLPNGDPLPYVPAGELPGFSVQFPAKPDYRIHLYVGVNVAAVFTELPDVGIPPELCMFGCLWPVTNQARTKTVGAIGVVLEKNGFPGGVYLATQLPPELARIIDELIRW